MSFRRGRRWRIGSIGSPAARARARRRAEAGEVERVGDRPDALAAAQRQAAAVVAAAKQVGRRGVAAAKDTPQVVGKMVSRLKGKAARLRPGRRGEHTNTTEARTSEEADAGPGATPAATTDSPRSGEPDSA
jgi:hypothetical protein